MMTLNINFREKAYRRERQAIMLGYIFSLLMLILTLYLFSDYLELSAILSEQENAVSKLEAERTRLMVEREKLKPVTSVPDHGFMDYESFLGRYVGRAPDAVLYDLEKTVPEGVYVTSLAYDRMSAVAVVNAVVNRSEHVTKILEALEQIADYSQVMLTNQAEMEEKGKTKIVFKLIDNSRGDGDE